MKIDQAVSYTHLDVYKRQAKTYADGHGESYSYDDWNRLAVKRQARTVTF